LDINRAFGFIIWSGIVSINEVNQIKCILQCPMLSKRQEEDRHVCAGARNLLSPWEWLRPGRCIVTSTSWTEKLVHM
jgi:hypothetical protein